jgi:2-haloacid dehalogenase
VLDFAPYRFLTFDCYGTLIDWEQGILAALRPILAAHAIAIADEQILERYADLEFAAEQAPYRPYRDVLATVIDGFGEQFGFSPTREERGALAASVRAWPPFPDTVESLQVLSTMFQLAIISNVDDDLFAGSARQLQADFAAVITAQQAGSYKPDLNNFRVALARIGAPAEQVLHVAQSVYHDIVPAKQLGLATVWVNRRHDRPGFGATPAAAAQPDLEVPDLATLARLTADGGWTGADVQP